MNARVFQLNPADAREGSGGGRGRITENGAYEGLITKAKHIQAETGTTGIEFEFESNGGESARFSLYTHKTDGSTIYGFKQLQALMTVLKLHSLQPAMATIEEYDYDTSSKVQIQAQIYGGLMKKPVGIVFQMEEYVSNQDGSIKTRANFFAPFDPSTKQLAAEILDRTPATKLDKILPTLKTKPVARPAAAYGSASSPQQHSGTQSAPDLSDIPF